MSGQLNPLMIAYSFRGRREVDESDGKTSVESDIAEDFLYNMTKEDLIKELKTIKEHFRELKQVQIWLPKSGDISFGRLRKQFFLVRNLQRYTNCFYMQRIFCPQVA